MKPQYPWDAIRFLWSLHYVSERLFCVKLCIDRTWVKEKAKREFWPVDDVLTIEQMEKALLAAQAAKDADLSAEILVNIRIRRTAWSVASETLRLAIGIARK